MKRRNDRSSKGGRQELPEELQELMYGFRIFKKLAGWILAPVLGSIGLLLAVWLAIGVTHMPQAQAVFALLPHAPSEGPAKTNK